MFERFADFTTKYSENKKTRFKGSGVTMSRRRGQRLCPRGPSVSPPGPSDSLLGPSDSLPGPPAAKPRPNRLSRSLSRSLTQAAAEAEAGSQKQQPEFKTPTRIPRCRTDQARESPHNDSDLQHDIIWDATSPSPSRLGKRGRRNPCGAVNISEIVSRIAPKHGRPEAAEPTLQQWIGDSAAIPCTPDVQLPKPRKKSPRPNGVDDLVKLAKQFDFNMFGQDAVEVEDSDRRPEDVADCPSPPAGRQPAPSAAAGTDVQAELDPDLEEDLEFLFDGPTQHVSAGLSQMSSHASGKCPTMTAVEDDWENDDFLDDSLVLEMTQSPQRFTAPLLCSTQRPAAWKTQKEVGRQRATFTLESNPDFSVRRTDARTKRRLDPSSETADRHSQHGGVPVETGYPRTLRTLDTARSEQSQDQGTSRPLGPEAVSSHIPPAAVSDFLDEDLDAFFSSDPVWDDPSDDVLLCEMCEDLENQIQDVGHVTTKQTLTGQKHRAALQPANQLRFHQAPPPTLLSHSGSGRPAGTSLAALSTCDRGRGSLTSTQTQSCSSAPPPQGGTNEEEFTFKRPHNPISTGTNKALGRCSAAEIELKKQQAIERRRRRLRAEQNL